MRVAAVDIGTNSTRLLIGDVEGAGLTTVERTSTVTGLGQGVDRTGRLNAPSMQRTIDVLARYGDRCRRLDVESVRAVATSACRDAVNREAFFDSATAALGHRPQLLTGEEEAAMSFGGATMGRADAGTQVVVIDIGGGSTEFVGSDVQRSVDIGSVRLSERTLPHHPASAIELDAARTEAARVIAGRDLPDREEATGVGGTWTSLAAIHLGLEAYDREAVEGSTLAIDEVRTLVNRLARMTIEEKSSLPGLDPKRGPVILGGAVVAEAAMQALAIPGVTVSEHDILDGVCLALAQVTEGRVETT